MLATYERVQGAPAPEAWVLCVRGESFELGEPLSRAAAKHVEAAWKALLSAVRTSRETQNTQP